MSFFHHVIEVLTKKLGVDISHFLRNSVWVAIRQAVTVVVGLGVSIAFARLTTQEVFGEYQLVLAIIGIVYIISLPGLNTSITQSTARGFEGSYTTAVRMSFIWSLAGIPLLLVLGAYYYVYDNSAVGIALMMSSIFFPLLYAPNTWDAFFQGKEMFRLSMEYASVQIIISGIVTVGVLFVFRDKLFAMMLVYLVSISVFNVLWFRMSLKHVGNTRKDDTTISYGKFMTKIGVLSMIANKIDAVIVGILLGPVQLAIYAIGMNLARRFFDLQKAASAIFVPRIAQKNTVSLRNYLVLFFLVAIASTLLFFLFPWLIPFLYSKKYADSVILAQIVILFLPFAMVNLLYNLHFVHFIRNKKIITLQSVIQPILRIGLMALFVTWWGVQGLAFSFGLQIVLNMIILFVLQIFIREGDSAPPRSV